MEFVPNEQVAVFFWSSPEKPHTHYGILMRLAVSEAFSKSRFLASLGKFLPKLAKWQRRMARKKKFRKNWRKAKARITQLHTKVANIRKDFLHKVSNDISKNHVVVVVEDLQVKSMSRSATKKVAQKSGLNRAILDASPFELRPL